MDSPVIINIESHRNQEQEIEIDVASGENQHQAIEININQQDQSSEYQLSEKQKHIIKNLIQNKVNDIQRLSITSAMFLVISENIQTEDQLEGKLRLDSQNMYDHLYLPNISDDLHNCQICFYKRNNHITKNDRSGNELINKLKMAKKLQEQIKNFIKEEKIKEEQNGECQICLDRFNLEDMIKINDKTHPICKQCMIQFLEDKINSAEVQNVSCPHCSETIETDQIKEQVDQRTYTKYQKFLHRAEIQANPLKRLCPNPLCDNVLELSEHDHINSTHKTAICNSCSNVMCLECNSAAHEGYTCEDQLNLELKDWAADNNVKRCPNCKVMGNRFEGCPSMTCPFCQLNWCWNCGQEMDRYHHTYNHPKLCPYIKQQQQWKKDHPCLTKTKEIIEIILYIIYVLIVGSLLAPFVGHFLMYDQLYYSKCFSSIKNCLVRFLIRLFLFPVGFLVLVSLILCFPCIVAQIIQVNRASMLRRRRNRRGYRSDSEQEFEQYEIDPRKIQRNSKKQNIQKVLVGDIDEIPYNSDNDLFRQ